MECTAMCCFHLVALFTGVVSRSKDVSLLLLLDEHRCVWQLCTFLTLYLHIGSHIMNVITQANTHFLWNIPTVSGFWGFMDSGMLNSLSVCNVAFYDAIATRGWRNTDPTQGYKIFYKTSLKWFSLQPILVCSLS